MKKLFSTPLFWTNVVTAAFMMFLAATVVFGWNNPTQTPPGGAGAISVDPSTGNVVIDPTGTALIDVKTSRITGVAPPSAGSDAVNLAYVEGQTGAGSSLTLWGECIASGGSCQPGQDVYTCPSGWTELYAGYGPYTFWDSETGKLPAEEPNMSFMAVDSLPICRYLGPAGGSGAYGEPYFTGTNAGTILNYHARWSVQGGEIANTCRVCIKN